MEGPVRDDGSRKTRTLNYRIAFGKSLRNRLGERYLIPVAPGLFAVSFFDNSTFRKTRQAIRDTTKDFFNMPCFILCVAFILISLTDKVHAVPICPKNFSPAWYSIESSRADRDLFGYNLVYPLYSGRAYGNFKEGDNIEWIYDALENQYSFLDDTLYRILGGNYLLGSVCFPHWHGFRYFYWVRDIDRNIICATDN
jgi:hypothetical protein